MSAHTTHSLVRLQDRSVVKMFDVLTAASGRTFSMLGYIADQDVVLARSTEQTKDFETFAPSAFGVEIVRDK